MKKYKFLIVISSLILLGACKKSFLDKQPLGAVSDATFWKTESDLTSATNNIYYLLSGNAVDGSDKFGSQWFPFAFNCPMNDLQQTSIPDVVTLMNQDFEGTNIWLNEIWKGGFKGVARCNRVIANAPAMTIDATFKNQKIAEAECLRGIFYLLLVRAYGDVPLLLTEQTGASNLTPHKTPKAQVLAQIVTDLTAAAAALPTTWDGADVGRVTKGTALGYLALTNLYQQNWTAAITNTEAIKALGIYGLWANYSDAYKWPDAENGKESLFEIQYADIPGQDQFYQQFIGLTDANGILKNGNNWSVLFPSKQFVQAFEPGDQRRWEVLTNGETISLLDGSAGTKVYTMDSTKNIATGGYGMRKYWIGCSVDGLGSPQNIIMLKYSEVLLNEAEAYANASQFSQAYALINQIRTRAGLPAKSGGDLTTAITDINHERRFENFADENGWFDLTRTGQAKKFLQDNYGINMPDRNYLYPIPADELQLNPNLMPNNPGY